MQTRRESNSMESPSKAAVYTYNGQKTQESLKIQAVDRKLTSRDSRPRRDGFGRDNRRDSDNRQKRRNNPDYDQKFDFSYTFSESEEEGDIKAFRNQKHTASQPEHDEVPRYHKIK